MNIAHTYYCPEACTLIKDNELVQCHAPIHPSQHKLPSVHTNNTLSAECRHAGETPNVCDQGEKVLQERRDTCVQSA